MPSCSLLWNRGRSKRFTATANLGLQAVPEALWEAWWKKHCAALHWKEVNVLKEGVTPSAFFFQVQQTGKRVDSETCYVSASELQRETMSKRSQPGKQA